MDGGKDTGGTSKKKEDSSTSAADMIMMALDCICQHLDKCGVDPETLKLDAWVVTHWDADHYKGVMDLLKNKKDESFLRFFKPQRRLYCGRYETRFTEQHDVRTWATGGVTAGEKLIGMDLFSGEWMFNQEGDIITPSPMNSDPWRPRFCVVGAKGHGVAWHKYQRWPSRNETSILAILYWPGHGGHCSYFTGGDGNPQVEVEAVYPFLMTCGFMNLGKGFDLMKLDHHGSSGENFHRGAVKLGDTSLSKFSPRNILVTPGDQFGHPSKC